MPLWKRPITGDVVRLFDLLSRTERDLSRRTLRDRGIERPEKVESGRAACAERLQTSDDVEAIVATLTVTHGADFCDISSTWRGPRTRLRTLIEELATVYGGQDANPQ